MKNKKILDNINLILILILFMSCISFDGSISGMKPLFRIVTIILFAFTVFKMIITNDCKIKNYKYLIIYGMLIIFACLSIIWTKNKEYTIGTIKNMMLLFIVSFSLTQYIDSKEKLKGVFKAYIFYSLFMCFILIFFEKNPAGTSLYGSAVGLYFNSIAHMLAIGAFISYYIFKDEKKKIYLLFIIIFYYIIFLTGSRKGLLFPIIAIGGIEVFDKRLSLNKILKLITVAIIGVTLITVLINSNEKMKERLSDLFLSFLGQSIEDKSVSEREFFREEAKYLFKNNPILRSGSWWLCCLYGKNKLFTCCILS